MSLYILLGPLFLSLSLGRTALQSTKMESRTGPQPEETDNQAALMSDYVARHSLDLQDVDRDPSEMEASVVWEFLIYFLNLS